MSNDGRAIANFILDFCDSEGRAVTNLSLQKLMFFCHARFLADQGKPLIKHQFEAWQFGPVLQYVYREFKQFESIPITCRAKSIDRTSGIMKIVVYDFEPSTRIFLAKVTDFYSQLTASDLVHMSHARGGPWDRVWNHSGRVNPGMRIGDVAIQDYYSKVRAPFVLQ